MFNKDESDFIESDIFEFEAETTKIMNLIINSFYSNREIFLRELTSNCSDSLDKLRHSKIKNNISLEKEDLRIQINPDKKNNTLIISDNGIGMSKSELIKNIGIIANSDTQKYIKNFKHKKRGQVENLIGEFGVGFYSAFLVADKVEIITRSYFDDEFVWSWESDSLGSYKITKILNSDLKNGCIVKLFLKKDCLHFLDEFRLRDIIKKHSQFINYTIEILVSKKITSKTQEKKNFFDNKSENLAEFVSYWEKINIDKPIWNRNPKTVTEIEYNSFYKNISKDTEDCLSFKHFIIEGSIEFRCIIFIPSKSQGDIFSTNNNKINFNLYSNRIFIMNDCKTLIPEWLSFIRGIIDSSSLPLNISREMLQENKIIPIMNKKIISKTIELITELYQDNSLKQKFYLSFSKNIKFAVYQSEDYQQKFSQFLQFYTTKSKYEFKTFDQYIDNLKENQKYIFYITGESFQCVEESIFLEIFNSNDIEVIYMFDTIDEYMLQSFTKYKDFQLISVYHEKIIDYLPISKSEHPLEHHQLLLTKFRKTLSQKVEDVIISNRLVFSPSCMVSSKDGWTPNMERIMKAQALGGDGYKSFIGNQKIMELNINHPIIQKISKSLSHKEESSEIEKNINLLYNISCLSSGFTVDSLPLLCQYLYHTLDSETKPGHQTEILKDKLNNMLGEPKLSKQRYYPEYLS